ncbi:LysR family transcriptional regulator [Pseudomonas sp. App30]|uniref:LysR family transcriptional regulator n=1 Tax=Pseudomonas sp. App30 TaxID=3068990 RepID=UPI003A7F8835
MRFHQLDLNLLFALDILLEEQNITRAAERLHMTQSATSGVLSRLRAYFDDELLVQVGRTMQPTPYAKQLELPVREVLLTIQSSITAKPVLDLSTSKRHFRLIISDYLISTVFATVVQEAYRQAPQISFELISPGDTSYHLLSRGEIDLMICPEQYLTSEHPSERIFDEEHVCVIWKDNTEIGEILSLEQYLEAGHVATGFGRNRRMGIEEWFMSEYGCARRIEVVTNNFTTLPQLVVGTHRIATMHRRLAIQFAALMPLRILPAPVKLPTITECMTWHRSMECDPMLRWLRRVILDTMSQPEPTTVAPLANAGVLRQDFTDHFRSLAPSRN